MQLSNHRWLQRSWRFLLSASVAMAGILLAARPAYPQPQERRLEAIPLFYIENQGQAEPEVRYMVRTPELSAFFMKSRVLFAWETSSMAMEFVGAGTESAIEGTEPLGGKASFLMGSNPGGWRTGLAMYGGVRYRGIYPGIDMLYTGSSKRVKSDFIVAPGADPSRIRIRYEGALGVRVLPDGSLSVRGPLGELREQPPEIYQELDGSRVPVEGAFLLHEDGTVGFRLAGYDRDRTLWIDPVITYSTYVGGSRIENATAVAVDTAGNAYVAGWTDSSNFPAAAGMRNFSGSVDAFVLKMNPAGSAVSYATFIGGAGDDRAYGLDIDPSGNAYVVGYTTSADFPVVGAVQSKLGGGRDAFCLKLNTNGSALVYSTYLGGSSDDVATGVGVDSFGQPYVAGETYSVNFPTRLPFQAARGGGRDAFAFKLGMTGALVYSTYLGGSGDDRATASAVSTTRTQYVVGCTDSSNFPTLNAAQPVRGGGQDVFVVRFNGDANRLVYGTYLGGNNGSSSRPECAYSVAVDSFHNAYVTGSTPSTNFPVVTPAQAAYGGGSLDAFVTKLNSGGALLYSSYLGGIGTDIGTSIRVDLNRRAFVGGYTSSNNFPVVAPVQPAFAGFYDGFFVRLSEPGSTIQMSSYLGGSGSDVILGLAWGPAGDLTVVGVTNSYNYPLQGAYQPSAGGSSDAFVSKIGGAGL